MNANEIQIPYDKDHKVSSLVKSHLNTYMQFCQIWSNMKMSNNPAKYKVLIKQYLRSILDIIALMLQKPGQAPVWLAPWLDVYLTGLPSKVIFQVTLRYGNQFFRAFV